MPFPIHQIILTLSPPFSASAVLNHPVYTTTSNIYHLNDVSCRGTEERLSECKYSEVGTTTCVKDHTDAGVKCMLA